MMTIQGIVDLSVVMIQFKKVSMVLGNPIFTSPLSQGFQMSQVFSEAEISLTVTCSMPL